jgi:hypothetical protein
MIEILLPLGKHKYDTWKILPVKCYIDNSMRLCSCIRNVNKYTKISSLKKTTNLSCSGMKIEFMRYMNYAGAFVNLNGMTRYSDRPYIIEKVVLGISSA